MRVPRAHDMRRLVARPRARDAGARAARQPRPFASAGQTLALFALLLPALIGAMAMGVDGANLWLRHRDAQTAADLAALAGARMLPDSPTLADQAAARTQALTIANANGYATGVTATTPYVDSGGTSHDDHVKVTIAATVNNYFLPVLGVSTFPVNVQAVALSSWTPTTGGALPAIFAGCSSSSGGTSCPDPTKAIDWSGSDGTVIGGTVSNCGMIVGGANNDFLGGTTWGPGCAFSNSGSGNVYSPARAQGTTRQPWPATYVYNDFLPCTVTRTGKLELKSYYQSGKTVTPGVYCATGSGAEIVLDEQYVVCHCTLVSEDKITISGSNFTLTAYHSSKVVLWANGTGSPTITMGGSNGSWTGIIYARRGQVEISGSNNVSGNGSILADRVKVGGQFISVNASGLGSLGSPVLDKLQLVE